MNALVGCTGFVGSNLYESGRFVAAYHSSDIQKAYGTKPDLLVYAGVRAEKYLANHEPAKDMELIYEAEENIGRIQPEKLVLISTVDVLKKPKGVDEAAEIDTDGLHPYGYNRYCLEQWVRSHYPDALIIRLPGLFGKNIKKNFIYDYIHVIPFMLTAQKFMELKQADPELKDYYDQQENGFYKVRFLSVQEATVLRDKFKRIGFSALNFTDSRSRYQFYSLHRLWADIQTALKNGLRLWHPAVEPVSAGEIYCFLTGKQFVNELEQIPADYDYRTMYAEIFGGKGGYICRKEDVLNDIAEFVKGQEIK